MATIGETVTRLTRAFADSTSPRLDARMLVGHVLKLEPSGLFARDRDEIASNDLQEIDRLAARRIAHEPVARILGQRAFYGLDFKLSGATLEPRPDTETLVDAALELRGHLAAPRILDLGTGTGCILLAILSQWPAATGRGVDISAEAVSTAQANAAALGLAERAVFTQGNWGDEISDRYDLIVSNPPYISDAEFMALAPDVRLYDPERALRGGSDGLDAYRAILDLTPRLLAVPGQLLLEIGASQADSVGGLAAAAGWRILSLRRDLSGNPRCLCAERP